MSKFKTSLSDFWARLNPAEPSTSFLIKLMAFMIGCFIFGLVVGHFT